ncbi:hypothetical protein H1C71_028247, partial [Ictidomys tridecemlineatus]
CLCVFARARSRGEANWRGDSDCKAVSLWPSWACHLGGNVGAEGLLASPRGLSSAGDPGPARGCAWWQQSGEEGWASSACARPLPSQATLDLRAQPASSAGPTDRLHPAPKLRRLHDE